MDLGCVRQTSFCFTVCVFFKQCFSFWKSLSQYLDKLPNESKSLTKLIQSNAIKLLKQEIKVDTHAAGVSARLMASVIVIRAEELMQHCSASENSL